MQVLKGGDVLARNPRHLNITEIKTIMNTVVIGSSLDVTVHLMLYAGLRVQECAYFRRSDIKRSLSSGLLHVRKEIAKYKKPRSIPVCKKLAKVLENWYSQPKNSNVRNGRLWNYSKRTVQRRLRRFFLSHCHIKCTPHDLRHTFATAVYWKPRDLSIVQSLLGHVSLKSTLIYVHIDGILQKEIAKAYDCFVELPGRQTYMDKLIVQQEEIVQPV